MRSFKIRENLASCDAHRDTHIRCQTGKEPHFQDRGTDKKTPKHVALTGQNILHFKNTFTQNNVTTST